MRYQARTTPGQHVAAPEVSCMLNGAPVTRQDRFAKTNLASGTGPLQQDLSRLLPGFVAWLVDGMKMETRAGRFY